MSHTERRILTYGITGSLVFHLLAAFGLATHEHPESAPAFINLATVLNELGDVKKARQAAESAVALGGPWKEQAVATLRAIKKK